MNTNGWTDTPNGWNETDNEFTYNSFYSELCSVNGPVDVIFVLAGGVDANGYIHEWVRRRLDVAIQIYCQKKCYIVCLGGGTYHKPPSLNHAGFVIHESTACCKYLIDAGIPYNKIYKEWSSYDTIANGFFSLVNYSTPRKWSNIVVITSQFHMPRAKAIFEWIYSLEPHYQYNLRFIEASDKGLDPDIINARRKREKKSLSNLQTTIKSIKNLDQFHCWLFTDHKAYASSSIHTVDHTIEVDETTQKSY